MSLAVFLAYCGALFLAAATPGPAMFAVIATGVPRGAWLAFAAGLGVAFGDVILVFIALFGMIALAQAFSAIFLVAKYVGAAYLIWLGYKMWRSAGELKQGETVPGGAGRSFLLGLTVALSNPKAILFHASLMPLILDLKALTLADGAIVLATVFTVNVVTMGVYAVLAGLSSSWFRTSSRLRWMNRIAGGAMIGTGAVIASR